MNRLKGKVAIITGAEEARIFAKEVEKIILTDIQEDK